MTFQTKMKMWWGSVVDDTEKVFHKGKKRMVTHEFYDNPNPPSARPKSMHRIASRASAASMSNMGSRRGSMGPRSRSAGSRGFGSQVDMRSNSVGNRNGAEMMAADQTGQYYNGGGGGNPYDPMNANMVYPAEGMGGEQGYGGPGMPQGVLPPGTMQPAYTGMPPPMNNFY